MAIKLGIIGTGKVGSALGLWAAKAGYTVLFSGRDPEKSRKAAAAAGAYAQAVPLTALDHEADLILPAVPFNAMKEALEPLKNLAGKTIIDVSNPLNDAHTELSLGHTTSGAEENARLAPNAHWVKAFNATFAEVYASQNPSIDGKTVTILYAGDHEEAKAQVRVFILKLGFDALDAGPLKNARYLEPLSMLNILLGKSLGLGTRIGYRVLR